VAMKAPCCKCGQLFLTQGTWDLCGKCIAKVRPKWPVRRFDKLLADVRAARSKR
jgi:hypothetical protein